ncbi:MAG: SDR family oxidoreductase [Halioglobus sp.]
MQWQGKSALVTGAATGIGRAVCIELAQRGAVVYVSALSLDEAQPVVDEITAAGGRAIAVKLNVTDNAEYLAAIQQVVAEHGRIDLLVNNAGMLYVGEYHDMDEAYLEQLIRVNHTAVAIGTLYGYRAMMQQGGGMIANVASQGGLMPVGTMAAYSGTKHAVVGLTGSVAGEAEAHGVVLKTICPGNVASDMLTKAQTRGTNAQGVLDALPGIMATDDAAKVIVDGLSGRRRKVIFPFYARVLGFIQRLWPEFGHKGAVHSITQFRRTRDDELSQH